MSEPQAARFYDEVYTGHGYADFPDSQQHFAFRELTAFIDQYDLRTKSCIEVGCGRGLFQDLVEDYTGVDLSRTVGEYLHKPFVACDATQLPFRDNTFDAAWSITVLEHVLDPQTALQEMCRVLKPGGLLLLKAAWHCRPWICEGIPVRPWADLSLRQRWIKATLFVRDALPVRAARVFPRRAMHLLASAFARRPRSLLYHRLPTNYEQFLMVDSDAAVSLDPLDVILWFRERGNEVVSHPTIRSTLFSRSESVVVRVIKK